MPRQILKAAAVATVPRSRHFATARADGFLLNMDDQSESVSVAFNTIQNQNVRAREKGLRMARGKCHRSKSLKQFRPILFWGRLHQNRGRAQFRIPKSTQASALSSITNSNHAWVQFIRPSDSAAQRREWTVFGESTTPRYTLAGYPCTPVLASSRPRVRAKISPGRIPAISPDHDHTLPEIKDRKECSHLLDCRCAVLGPCCVPRNEQ